MGTLTYKHETFEMDDRVLAHLQILVSTKLRRHEPFTLSWTVPVEQGSGRRTLWIDNGVPIHFAFFGNRSATINLHWVEVLLEASHRPGGVVVGDEPE